MRGETSISMSNATKQTKPTVHDAFKVALLFLRLRRGGILVSAVDELALVPPLDVVDGGHEAVDGGGGRVGAADDADLLLGRAEHATDAATATGLAIVDAGSKVRRLPGRRR